ncbi:MAG: hypothetical protein HGB32_13430 [Geobacteraceae bacterium]|nr:hypothetical protein [Geobacteraceae bacterium]NTW81128.1 hypothetical protein [Geobacteraceae bacterium]
MQMKKLIMPFCLLSMAAMLYGCGSSSKTGGTLGSVANVSEASCAQCHSGRLESLTGNDIYADYYASIHSLKNVGCQGCHGGGAQHNGVGPLPYADPSLGGCIQCHASDDASLAKVVTSKHGAGELETDQICNRCHTHEGAVQAMKSGFTGDKDALANNLAAAPGDLTTENARNIKCDTCHTSHKPDVLRSVIGWVPSNVVVDGTTVLAAVPTTNQQFTMCTSCHTYTKADGTLVGSGNTLTLAVTDEDGVALPDTTIVTSKFQHETAWYRIIGSTHYDNPNTPFVIEGYVLRTNTANPCFDCHNHEAKTNTGNLASSLNAEGTRIYELDTTVASTIYTDWAKSKKAGRLLTKKYEAQDTYTKKADGSYDRSKGMTDAVMKAGVTIADAAAWAEEGGVTSMSCARCHTSTGAVSYLNSPTAYATDTLDFSHRIGGQKEMLYCWGCHSNAGKGTTRTPGAITALYTYNTAAITFPNVSNSNICMACHSSRRNVIDNSRSTSFRPHYLPAGGILFSSQSHMMYEFDVDADGDRAEHYANPSYFAHDKIGTVDKPGTGTSGPCVACHMSGSTHTFSPVTKTGETITAIKGQSTCNTCHTTYPISAAKLQEESEGYQETGLLLTAYLTNTITNAMGIDISAVVTNATTVPDIRYYGAYQNSLLPTKEKGGYAHNRYYVKRLLFDSIDWVDNGAFDGTITIPAGYPEARAWFGANATTGVVAARP